MSTTKTADTTQLIGFVDWSRSRALAYVIITRRVFVFLVARSVDTFAICRII